ncbi:MFS transporter [Sciscionella marina]|uniref:MFS transporter n=1 Tax=Sciscionella marina TaxID=508770 RepID=UPI00036B1F63|nr:MFS transporter [Sciscionella marina]
MTAATDSRIARRSVVAASFGNAMEWYDFSVYAFFASYIAGNFFTSGDPTSALLSTFVVFGAGFVARPIGAILVGIYGDRVGRKSALMLSIGSMGIGTLLLVVAPPVTLIGVGAPILLLAGRLLQGFSAGGEIGGAAAFMLEHAPADKRGRYASWLQASMGLSNLLSAVIGFAITSFFPDSAVRDWAWRIPFLVGLLIIPVGLYVRRKLPETAQFTAQRPEQRRNPLFTLLREHPMRILSGFLFSVQWTVCVYAFVIYLPTYYKEPAIGLGFTGQESFLASLMGNIVLVAGCVAAGRLADRIGAKPLIVASSLALLVLPVLLLLWLRAQPNLTVLLIVHTVLCASVAGFVGVAPSTLPRAFPVAVRSTGLALSYNIAAIAFAGTTPALMTWATVRLTTLAPALWVMLGSVASLVVIPLLVKQIRQVSEQESAPRNDLSEV